MGFRGCWAHFNTSMQITKPQTSILIFLFKQWPLKPILEQTRYQVRPQMKYFSIILSFQEFQEDAKSISIPYFVIADSRFPFWAPDSISEPWSQI